MFISVLKLLKLGVGPSSSHTMGPMNAAYAFRQKVEALPHVEGAIGHLRCTLRGSLAFTGRGHATDRAICFGLHGHTPAGLQTEDVAALWNDLKCVGDITFGSQIVRFNVVDDVIFDLGPALPEHPNGLQFEYRLVGTGDSNDGTTLSQTYFSIGGGFITTADGLSETVAPLQMEEGPRCPYPFESAKAMLRMAGESGLSIAQMKRKNEKTMHPEIALDAGLDRIAEAMRQCVKRGLSTRGLLPGGLLIRRRAGDLATQLENDPEDADRSDWLCAYAMAVNEENAAGHAVVTAPTNGAAGVMAAVLHFERVHRNATRKQIHDYLLTAAAIGGLIKHRSSISGAEVGCQGEVGSAASMAAAGLCAMRGGSVAQVEHAAESALEHHLGLTCDPVAGLVQVPCIERNGFGAIKAFAAASLALRSDGEHFMPLDACILAMRQTGLEMSTKYKETSLGGLAVSITEC